MAIEYRLDQIHIVFICVACSFAVSAPNCNEIVPGSEPKGSANECFCGTMEGLRGWTPSMMGANPACNQAAFDRLWTPEALRGKDCACPDNLPQWELDALTGVFDALGFFEYYLIENGSLPCSWPGVDCGARWDRTTNKSTVHVLGLYLSTCNAYLFNDSANLNKCWKTSYEIPIIHLSRLRYLRSLEFLGSEIIDDIAKFSLLSRSRLRELLVVGTGINGDVSSLKLPRLKMLYLVDTEVGGNLCGGGTGLGILQELVVSNTKIGGAVECLKEFPWLMRLELDTDFHGQLSDLVRSAPHVGILRLWNMTHLHGSFSELFQLKSVSILTLGGCSGIDGHFDVDFREHRYSLLDITGTNITIFEDTEDFLNNTLKLFKRDGGINVNNSVCYRVGSRSKTNEVRVTPETFAPESLCECKPGYYGKVLKCMLPCGFGREEDLETLSCFPDQRLVFACLIIYSVVIFHCLGGKLRIQDIHHKVDGTGVMTWTRHWLLRRNAVLQNIVFFSDTGHPVLESHDAKFNVVRTTMYRFDLVKVGDSSHIETSTGYVHFTIAGTLLFRGCVLPVGAWIALGAGVFGIFFHRIAQHVHYNYLILWIMICLVVSFIVAELGQNLFSHAPLTRLIKAYQRNALKSSPSFVLKGAGRAIDAKQLLEFYSFFYDFIRERNMYFIVSNIVKPVTKPFRVSFAELSGPTKVKWFVSHYWGTPFVHLVDTVRCHSRGVHQGTYWICSFSNNQWNIEGELGASWEESSFLMAIRSSECLGTVLVLDDHALPLTRSWCLFELVQTLQRKENEQFVLELCSTTGVLSRGESSVDMAVSIARRLSTLRLEDASATNKDDFDMIQRFVEQNGGFPQMNSFIRREMGIAMMAVRKHFETDMEDLLSTLETSRLNENVMTAPLSEFCRNIAANMHSSDPSSIRRAAAFEELDRARENTLMIDHATQRTSSQSRANALMVDQTPQRIIADHRMSAPISLPSRVASMFRRGRPRSSRTVNTFEAHDDLGQSFVEVQEIISQKSLTFS